MLFSMLQTASLFDNDGDRENSNNIGDAFLQRAGQALVAGHYHRGRPYSVEALLLYAYCKWVYREDQEKDAWVIMGISVRLAMRMGYHRDPCHLTSITPFEGEMRRRTFFLVEVFDLLFAFQAGLPAIIHEEECDVEPPRNLFDTDFDEDCQEVPLSRPPTDPTPMLYFCYKCRMAKSFRRVIRHALSLKGSSYEETMELDKEIQEIHEDVPPSLRMRPLSLSFIEPASTTSQRLTIDLMYLKCLCVLHRSSLSHSRLDPKYDYSRKTCIDAALRVLSYQAELHAACQPGGLYHHSQWMVSGIAMRDSLLAAMIICLDLYESRLEPMGISGAHRDNAERYHALQACHEIWLSRKASSREAVRASKVLGFMLSKLPRPAPSEYQASAPTGISSVSLGSGGQDNLASTETSSTNLIGGATQLSLAGENGNTLEDFSFDDPLFTMFDDSYDFDWVSTNGLG